MLALALRLVPAAAAMTAADHSVMLQLIDGTLATRPAAMRRQFSLFLLILRWAPALRYGRPLDHLPPSAQDAALRWFQRCDVLRFRSGFWGVRTLVMLGYYGRPDLGPSIAYTPSTSGNAVLHARTRR
ncbi:MAG: hypothetical protein NTY02_09705 [Acidobacteria bacterium]|nr:hypothetical protein [Acidobacteriota bacterium]